MALFDLFSQVSPQASAAKRVVGIDVGASSIKVVELENRNEVVTLTTYGELQLGPYIEGNVVGQAVTLTASLERQALVDVLRESAVKARSAVFAMPLASSFVTTMSLVAGADEDVSPRVRVEARKYIPLPITEVTLDWAEVYTNTKGNANKRDILLAAIQNDALKRFNSLLETVEFKNSPTEIECFSVIRSLYLESEPDIAILDVGAISTKMYIVRGGLLQRMYRVRAGGALYTEKIVSELGISFEEAETLKRSITPADEHWAQLQKIHTATFVRVLKEFRQVLEEYETASGVTVSEVYAVGGASQFPNFTALMSDQFGRAVILGQPFNKVAYPAFMEDTMNQIGSSFTVALGAALRSFE